MNAEEHLVQRVEIEGFRGIRKGELELHPLTVLVGLNGSGKTAVLEALYLSGGHREGILQIDDVDLSGRCPILYVLQRHGYQGAEMWSPDGELVIESLQGEAEPNRYVAQLILRGPKWLIYPEAEEARVRIRSFPTPLEKSQWGRRRQAVLLDPFAGPELEEALWFPGDPRDPALLRTPPILKKGRDEQVVEWMREVYPDLPLKRLSGGRGGGERRQTVWAVFEDHVVAVEQLGDGIQRTLRALALLAVMENGLFLWDEPEAHQHPDALRNLMRVLIRILSRRPGLQVVMATQSREVLEAILDAASENEEWAKEAVSVVFTMLDLRDGTLYTEPLSFDEFRFMESVDVDIRKLWRGRRIREPRQIPRALLERISKIPIE